MRAVLQRVDRASVKVDFEITGKINQGLLILLGIESEDRQEDIDWLVKKIVNMRIFPDENSKMNSSLLDIKGEALVVSQFTLHASTKKGNRPSFTKAAAPDFARTMYEQFISKLQENITTGVQTGKFGGDMSVELVNNGPVTINIDSKDKV
ncbi:D-aminoacyl-tRNA deacylase [Psychroflexus aestuariivivens]|uniref:D-aminoacyl-tRNA deacylase n=1 Tax=Psychroflexus aestuariivivens TaxID=1795040 RepID=UPI000FD89839|nr:D-aminoacyl-tRNA deacylase [Psychroflexus aestuariivivens]